MDGATIILNLAYVGLISATVARTMVPLRMALISAAVFFIAFGIWEDIPSMIFWNVIIGSLHSLQLAKHLSQRGKVQLTGEQEIFRKQLFPQLAAPDFHTLWSLGEDEHSFDEPLTTQGESHHMVGVVLDGVVDVYRDGESVARLKSGALIGEMSFVSEGVANADAVANGPVRIRAWDQSRLRSLDSLNPKASRALTKLIAGDLVHKLDSTPKGTISKG